MSVFFIAYFLLCISTFILAYIFSLIVLKEKSEIVKSKLYIVIPLYCILCWAGYFMFAGNFFKNPSYDFLNYYYCGRRLLEDPKDLYKSDLRYGYRYGYKYLPNFAILIGLPLFFLPSVEFAYYVFFIINIFLGLIFTLLFNKLLVLLDVKRGVYRFLFLIAISNGWIVLQLYANNQIKYLVGVIILFIINREIQYTKHQIQKNFKYYFIHLNLFVFIVGLAQYFIFLLLIYLFHNISLKQLFKKENIKKYLTIIISFILQNIVFIIYPDLLFDFYEIYQKEQRRNDLKLKHFYLEYIDDYVYVLPSPYKFYISVILNLILYVIILILILHRRLSLIEKFGYFSLSILYLNYIAFRILLNITPFICILFIPHLNQTKRGIEIIKENIYVLIGLVSISGIFFIPHKDAFGYPFIEGIYLGHLIFVITLGVSFMALFLRKRRFKKIDFTEDL
ncbi:MAG: hypothetical protein ACFFBP_13035 [Promethearchaeota archaeon]